MKLKLLQTAFVLLIRVATTIATLRAIGLVWKNDWEQAKKVLRLQDRALSASKGWPDQYTVSALCIQNDKKDCLLCNIVRSLLGQKHIDDSAGDEGVTPDGFVQRSGE